MCRCVDGDCGPPYRLDFVAAVRKIRRLLNCVNDRCLVSIRCWQPNKWTVGRSLNLPIEQIQFFSTVKRPLKESIYIIIYCKVWCFLVFCHDWNLGGLNIHDRHLFKKPIAITPYVLLFSFFQNLAIEQKQFWFWLSSFVQTNTKMIKIIFNLCFHTPFIAIIRLLPETAVQRSISVKPIRKEMDSRSSDEENDYKIAVAFEV